MKTANIFVVGSFVTGISLVLPRPPHPGETLEGSHFDLGIGGKGNNQAMAAHKLGAKTNVILKIGDDVFGKMLLDEYDKIGLDKKNIIVEEKTQSGVGLVYLQEDGENTIGLYKGANELLSIEDIKSVSEEIKNADILMLQLEIPDDTIKEAAKIAKESGVRVLLNPSPVRKLDKELLQNVDILVLNLGEAGMILNKPTENIIDIEEIKVLAKELKELGPKMIVLTLGAKGALLLEDKRGFIFQKALEIKALDTVGAGDSFTGAFAVALAEGHTLERSLLLASANGAFTATKYGVSNALPNKSQIQVLLNEKGKLDLN